MDNIRNSDGTFGKGNTYAVGHSTKEKEIRDDFRKILFECVNEDDFRKAIERLKTLIFSKDNKTSLAALKLFMEYTTRKPVERVEMETSNVMSKEEKCALIKKTIMENLNLE